MAPLSASSPGCSMPPVAATKCLQRHHRERGAFLVIGSAASHRLRTVDRVGGGLRLDQLRRRALPIKATVLRPSPGRRWSRGCPPTSIAGGVGSLLPAAAGPYLRFGGQNPPATDISGNGDISDSGDTTCRAAPGAGSEPQAKASTAREPAEKCPLSWPRSLDDLRVSAPPETFDEDGGRRDGRRRNLRRAQKLLSLAGAEVPRAWWQPWRPPSQPPTDPETFVTIRRGSPTSMVAAVPRPVATSDGMVAAVTAAVATSDAPRNFCHRPARKSHPHGGSRDEARRNLRRTQELSSLAGAEVRRACGRRAEAHRHLRRTRKLLSPASAGFPKT